MFWSAPPGSETAPNPKSRAFVEAFKAKYGAVPDQFAAQAYQGAWIPGDSAIKNAGSRPTVRPFETRWRRFVTSTASWGKFSFNEKRDPVHPQCHPGRQRWPVYGSSVGLHGPDASSLDPVYLGQNLVDGLSRGAVYSVFALGFTLIFGILDIVNLAHAATYMWCAFAGWLVLSIFGLPLPIALVVSMAAGALVAVVLEFAAFRPLRREGADRLATDDQQHRGIAHSRQSRRGGLRFEHPPLSPTMFSTPDL